MEKITTNIDQNGRILIPSEIRERLNIKPGDKVNLEICDNELKIISANQLIEEMHAIFTKNSTNKKESIVEDFIKQKREEYQLEEARKTKNGQ